MIYRLHYNDSADGSSGFAFTASRRQAERFRAKWMADNPEMRTEADCEIDAAQTPRTRAAVLQLLTLWGSHADNG